MSLERVLEPEVMDTSEEAQDYNSMDHSGVNTLFVEDLIQFAGACEQQLGNVLDLGTGTALIPIELCQSDFRCSITAIDMAAHMLTLAQQNVDDAGLSERISLQRVDAKSLTFSDGHFECCMSNSIVHHIPEPISCLRELVRVTAKGGIIFVRDLLRPQTDTEVKQLVQSYAGQENQHSQQMFDDSLHAALSLEEIRNIVTQLGIDSQTVTATSDRHWTWAAIK